MTKHIYTLVIVAPDELDRDTLDEINEGRATHDVTWTDAVGRWLGGKVNDAETLMGNSLPEGWSAEIYSAPL